MYIIIEVQQQFVILSTSKIHQTFSHAWPSSLYIDSGLSNVNPLMEYEICLIKIVFLMFHLNHLVSPRFSCFSPIFSFLGSFQRLIERNSREMNCYRLHEQQPARSCCSDQQDVDSKSREPCQSSLWFGVVNADFVNFKPRTKCYYLLVDLCF